MVEFKTPNYPNHREEKQVTTYSPKKYAADMELRVNPTTMVHYRIQARGVEHRDAFILALRGGGFAWLVQHRAGGRGQPVAETVYYLEQGTAPVLQDPWWLPMLRKAGGVTETVTICALRNRHPDSDWLRETHHRYLLPILRAAPGAGFFHVNAMCHYFKVYELNPSRYFSNHWSGQGGKS